MHRKQVLGFLQQELKPEVRASLGQSRACLWLCHQDAQRGPPAQPQAPTHEWGHLRPSPNPLAGPERRKKKCAIWRAKFTPSNPPSHTPYPKVTLWGDILMPQVALMCLEEKKTLAILLWLSPKWYREISWNSELLWHLLFWINRTIQVTRRRWDDVFPADAKP